MKRNLSRREFLKLAGALPTGMAADTWLRNIEIRHQDQSSKKNVLVIVFDAFSAYNVSLYGYSRQTTPNISRLAKRGIVYHQHYAGGNFTTPGTASLLTGVLPWTHRAFNPRGEVTDAFIQKNLFSAFPDHFKIAYTHNLWADVILRQFDENINEHIQREKLLLGSNNFIHKLFKNDDDIATVGWIRSTEFSEAGYSYSLFFSRLYELLQQQKYQDLQKLYPLGIPTAGRAADDTFVLGQAMNYIKERIASIPGPFLGYFHFLPPHDPYRPSAEYYGVFHGDGYKPIDKPIDLFQTRINQGLDRKRREYDEFILYCDNEFNKLFEFLETTGILENTIVVLTSDHGELNERGISGHSTNALYEPVVRIPLIIFEPGRQEGVNIFEPTSAIDVLPTLAHLAGQSPPEWSEGRILPPITNSKEESVYAVRANDNPKHAALTSASTMLVKEDYKIIYYFGYPEVSQNGIIKVFNLQNDPEELTDLSASKPETTRELLNELNEKITEVNAPYL